MSKIELIDWMIFDDLRREDSGKLIYIGVYPDNEIVVGRTPLVLPKLVFSTKWKAGNNLKKYEFNVIAPDNKVAATVSGEMQTSEKEREVSTIHFGASPFKIEEPGEYKIEGKINNKKYDIGTFRVTLRSVEK